MINELYFQALRIRMIEERIATEYPKGEMRCPVHLSIGQEAPAVGVCAALRPQDKMVSTHRGHAHYLAKGGSLKGLIGELYGKSTGCSKGNGGSMHLIDLDVNFWGSTSIVGGTIPIGVGLAFADKQKGSDAVTAICIGDAAIEEGVFHEAANFAGLNKLNVLFVCENNSYSCFTHITKRQPLAENGRRIRSMSVVAQAHGLGYSKTYPTIGSVAFMTSKALRKLPHFIEIPTWRLLQHCGPDKDDHLKYRTSRDINRWKKKDLERGLKRDNEEYQVLRDEITEAFEHAKLAVYPPESDVGRFVYAPA